jgi:hypothetical protein
MSIREAAEQLFSRLWFSPRGLHALAQGLGKLWLDLPGYCPIVLFAFFPPVLQVEYAQQLYKERRLWADSPDLEGYEGLTWG